jgi:putative membrane protein
MAANMPAGEVLSRIHAANQEEIEVGQLAKEKAVSPKIKAYGEMLLKDHTDADKQVMALAKDESLKLDHNVSPRDPEDAKVMAKHAEAKAKMKSLTGKKFDEEFTMAMNKGHGDVLSLLKTMQTDDKNVQALVAKLIPKLEEHKQIAANLETEAAKE